MKGWMYLVGCLLVVLEVAAQPPIALVDIPAGVKESRDMEFRESSETFEVRAGLVFIEAYLNGVAGMYVVDTGAPGLVLNQKPEGENDLEGRGVTGTLAVEETQVDQFQLGLVQFRKLKAYKIDLSHLENRLHCRIDGLIGYEVLREMEIVLDYPNQVITFRSGNGWDIDRESGAGFTFHLVNHIPVVEASLGKRSISLGLDTGAGANVLNKHLGNPYRAKNSARQRIRGVDRKMKNTMAVQVPVAIDGLELSKQDQEYWLLNLSQLHIDLDRPIDGLLGFPFLKDGKWSINYHTSRIRLYNP